MLCGSGFDLLAEGFAGEGELVGDLQRTEALGTRVVRPELDAMTAFATGQRDGRTEIDAGLRWNRRARQGWTGQ